MNEQGTEKHGHNTIGGNANNKERDISACRRRIIGRFRPGHPLDDPCPELLWVLGKMRDEGELPNDTHFKVSAHTGHGNPASARLLEEIGADSFNPVRDLQIPMIASIRNAIDISIDLHTENPQSSGGFIRHYEVPDIIKYAAPVYLKTGGAVAGHHGWDTTEKQAAERIRQVSLVQDMINRYYGDAVRSKKGTSDLAIPR